jgi:signal transduction histidine kinase
MKKRLTLLYVTAFVLPMAALLLFGTRAVLNERYRYKESIAEEYTARLSVMRRDILGILNLYEERLLRVLPLADMEPEEIRREVRESSFIRQVFIVNAEGELIYPSRENPGNREKAFFERTALLWKGGVSFGSLPEASSADRGWYPYYEGNVISYIHWHLLDDGRIFGADLFREALIADMFLSISGWENRGEALHRILLKDELGRDLFISGAYEPAPQEPPLVTAPLPPPLAGWRLEAYAGRELLSPPGTGLPFVLFGLALLVALGGTGYFLWKETRREIQDAGRKVSFVNQVSHELKTPLTNIRMYAELLTFRLSSGSREHDFSAVILRESERLSRMISNVLTFSRESAVMRIEPIDPDAVIRRVAEAMESGRKERPLSVEFAGGVDAPLLLDGDILEQISWNILSNADKYAAGGGHILITTEMKEHIFTARFRDWGPGISPRKSEAVFKPFYRIRDSLTEGVSGTGLGLSISRELARAHGGDLRLEHPGEGCLFVLSLRTEKEEDV